ncbi:hypothetical protein CspHIS471_0701440 [Cutaneotrichosporon sp. HIS471]|nr:hypothetical protein CspHIS471_0701440 [Cutaneotrichosporon sp. HIS471]
MNGSDFGVIGGSRTPTGGRAAVGYSAPTRASSFSVAEKLDQKQSSLIRTLSSHMEERTMPRTTSPSQFPTFSPSSSPSTSPTLSGQHALPDSGGAQYSPPIAPANVSRSRSQSMATGNRPDRNFIKPMTTFDSPTSIRFEEPWPSNNDASNMSPFGGNIRTFGEADEQQQRPTATQAASFRTPQDPTFGSRAAWKSPTTSALTASVSKALGSQPSYSSVVGGFDDSTNGGRSGTNSRRHSMSVVGAGPRRGFSYNEGQAMSTLKASSRRGVTMGFTDEELLPERLSNALSLTQVDEPHSESEVATSLPMFTPQIGEPPRSIPRSNPAPADPFFSSSQEKQERSKFNFENTRGRASFSMPPGPGSGSSPDSGREAHRPTPVGAPVRAPAPGAGAFGNPMYDARFGAPSRSGFPGGPFSQPPIGPGPTFGRPPSGFGGFYGGVGQPQGGPRPPFPQSGGFGGMGGGMGGMGGMGMGGMGGMGMGGAMGGSVGGGMGPGFAPGPGGFLGGPVPPGPGQLPGSGFGGPGSQPNYFAPQPSAPGAPTSPSSFSSLSLADLGKGIPLTNLAPTTPLYIVTFKAGRRDVFYCPDPTLLISNGDRVIVEADRGSDLGTVVYDQLTPIDVREWQEKQATQALLHGASPHQPPGMTLSGADQQQPPPGNSDGITGHKRTNSGPVRPPAPGQLDFSGSDLNTLLSGVGPSGSQMDMGGGGIGARGPLAKEIMPKRIFTKSSGGPEEQARMVEKLKDEYDAMLICREKVVQRGLPMQIVDAEYQWDRRKLTFYFKAEKRVDFRELTKENFRIFKSRIWMSMVPKDDPRGGPTSPGAAPGGPMSAMPV